MFSLNIYWAEDIECLIADTATTRYVLAPLGGCYSSASLTNPADTLEIHKAYWDELKERKRLQDAPYV